MTIGLLAVSIDGANPTALATFWAAALDRPINDGASESFAAVGVRDAATGGPLLMFHRVPETTTIQNRVHLDLTTTELAAEADRLQELGATIVRDVSENGNHWITLADPEGNEFDLISI